MRNTIKAAIAAGPAGILTLGGLALYAQHELHYLLRPSVIETAAGVGAVVGGILWSTAASKRKANREAVEQAPPQQALPPSVPTQHFLSDGVVEQRLAQLAKTIKRV